MVNEIEIIELSVMEIDSVSGGQPHCQRETVLICDSNGQCQPVSMVVCDI